jgi:hypothetical protein
MQGSVDGRLLISVSKSGSFKGRGEGAQGRCLGPFLGQGLKSGWTGLLGRCAGALNSGQ